MGRVGGRGVVHQTAFSTWVCSGPPVAALANQGGVHSLMVYVQLFLCLRLRLPLSRMP